MNPERTKELALALTAIPSVTDSAEEGRFASFLLDLLSEWPYFRAHPEHLKAERTLEDERERFIVLALVRVGEPVDAPAVILTGHYDVVSTAPYGRLEPFAFDPEALAARLKEELEAEAESARAHGTSLGVARERALSDLASGDFLPGRGLLDMKAGLAAGLALLEDFAAEALETERKAGAADGLRPRALLFLAVPDEEGSSHGMLSAVRILPRILDEWGVKPRAAINLDAAVDQGEGEQGRAIFLGSVGKLHPFTLFVGRPSHAGAPFDGINPALLAAEYARRVECAVELFGKAEGLSPAAIPAAGLEPPPPPTILYYREIRDHYDVTTPDSVFVSVNLLSFEHGPEEALAAVSRLASEAMEASLGLLRGRAAAYSRASGWDFAIPDREPLVIPWAELEKTARKIDDPAWEKARAAARAAPDKMAALAGLASAAVAIAGIEGPAAIVGLAPPYYPRAALDSGRDGDLLRLLAREAAALEADGFGRISCRPFFPGISDMSFLYPQDAPEARLLASGACPFGLDALPGGFSCPVINIGPWGREYHQRLERAHAAYAFETLPLLLERVTRAILG